MLDLRLAFLLIASASLIVSSPVVVRPMLSSERASYPSTTSILNVHPLSTMAMRTVLNSLSASSGSPDPRRHRPWVSPSQPCISILSASS